MGEKLTKDKIVEFVRTLTDEEINVLNILLDFLLEQQQNKKHPRQF